MNIKRWYDQSYDVFLPASLKGAVNSYRDFPVFWWNFAVVDAGADVPAVAGKLCADAPCGDFRLLAHDWLGDAAVRQPYPGAAQFKTAYQGAMAKAALPMPREMTELLRRDPLNSLADLQQRLDSKLSGFERQGQWLRDAESGRALIPLKFHFPPNETFKTVPLAEKVGGAGATLLGSHAGTLENELRIRADVGTVSAVGTISLALLITFILFSKRHRLLWLLPLLTLSTAAAAALTVFVFGSIHAISLSFGPGLIGLAMDFGIHAAFLDPRSRATWRSNFMALLTSLVIIVLLAFSSIPLLQQMMFFALTGLTLSYGLFYLCMTWRPDWFAVKPMNLTPKPRPILSVVAMALMAGAFTIFLQPLRLDLDSLNFETPKTRELREWFFHRTGGEAPIHVIEDPTIMAWARGNGIQYDGPSVLLPGVEQQKLNLSTWKEPCAKGLFPDSGAQKFFAPFEQAVCSNLEPRDLKFTTPAYVRDFTDGKQWIAILRPGTSEHAKMIHERYPSAVSPREMLKEFPTRFAAELRWMLPVALIGAFVFLLAYYRGLLPALAACLPFAAGVGCYSMVTLVFGLPVTFISLMGLLLVFGFSIDYGIFAVDSRARTAAEQNGVWSALTLCAVSTLAGFAPMAMGQHPVLNSLGHALLWGSVGTYLGAFWGVPAVYRWLT